MQVNTTYMCVDFKRNTKRKGDELQQMHDILKIKKLPRLLGSTTPSFCLDDCLATYAVTVKGEYEFAYFDALRAVYSSKESKTKGIGKSVDFDILIEENLAKYVGIKREKLSVDAKEGIKQILQEADENVAYQLTMLGFDCPWDWRFQVIKAGAHSLYIVGWDEEKKELECLDPYYEKQQVYLPYENYINGFMYLTKVTYEPCEDFNPEQVLKEKLKNLLQSGQITTLKEMAKDIKEHFDLKLEIDQYNENEFFDMNEIQHRIHINSVMKELSHNRVRFAVMLQKLARKDSKKREELDKLADDVLHLAEKWDSVRMMLIKKVFVRKTGKIAEYLSKKTLDVVEQEEIYIQKLIHVLEGKQIKDEETQVSEKGKNDGVTIFANLIPFFNNEGIGQYGSKTADFNNSEEYFIRDKFPINSKVCYLDTEFFMPEKQEGKEDNIACSRQVIHIKHGYYTSIAFLGCSEWGNYKEDVVINYEDGVKDIYRMELGDWMPNLEFGQPQNIAFQSEKAVVLVNGKLVDVEECNTYVAHIHTKRDKKITSITLPECINMHIFAITLKERI